jgi:hypothetical protein
VILDKLQSNFKSVIVELILKGEAKNALNLLSKEYKVDKPKLKVGLPKGHKTKILGCYVLKNSSITLYNRNLLTNPYVILHEFYHHLRTNINKKHLGTEKNADKFALEYITQYNIRNQKKVLTKNLKDDRKQK